MARVVETETQQRPTMSRRRASRTGNLRSFAKVAGAGFRAFCPLMAERGLTLSINNLVRPHVATPAGPPTSPLVYP
jgi:hypothetical protein